MFWRKWAYAQAGSCGSHHHGHHEHRHRHEDHWSESRAHGWGSSFGVRRPLRFLARQLDLSEDQTAELAAVLDALKTQRAQAKVDHKKAIGAIADALSADPFDAAAVKKATEARAESAAEVERAVVLVLQKVHALLSPEQRKRLAYLLRTDGISI
jgi:Spy/CpxP family protein refolding chaperone